MYTFDRLTLRLFHTIIIIMSAILTSSSLSALQRLQPETTHTHYALKNNKIQCPIYMPAIFTYKSMERKR